VLAQQEVTVVSRFELPDTIVLRRYGTSDTLEWVAPKRASTLPDACDLAILAVPYERVHQATKQLVASSVPVLVLTPLLPLDLSELNTRLGAARSMSRCPGVLASYARGEAVVNHIMPKAAPTLLDARSPAPPIENLARTLSVLGFPPSTGRVWMPR
jgi:predicted dinucleotide-binding enzyme